MNYQKYAAKALDKITEYGSPCKILRETGNEIYNAETNEYESKIIEITGNAIEGAYSLANIDGTNIRAGDIRLMASFGEVPKVDDKLYWGEKEYTIVSLREIKPDGKTVIYYDVQCR